MVCHEQQNTKQPVLWKLWSAMVLNEVLQFKGAGSASSHVSETSLADCRALQPTCIGHAEQTAALVLDLEVLILQGKGDVR